jgi:GNAT superfamily N-acetyltransferase
MVAGMAPEADRYLVSTDPGRIDVDFVSSALAESYWAQGRPRSVIEDSIRNSLCFGLYERTGGRQLGFARVVTDGATFSWICDVIVDRGSRGRGLGKMLMESVANHPVVSGTMCLLATRDAHGLYERHGFVRSEAMRRPAQKAP